MNKIILTGNLGQKPELRKANSGMAITNLRIATNERVKDGDQYKDHTEWHTVVVFGKQAEADENLIPCFTVGALKHRVLNLFLTGGIILIQGKSAGQFFRIQTSAFHLRIILLVALQVVLDLLQETLCKSTGDAAVFKNQGSNFHFEGRCAQGFGQLNHGLFSSIFGGLSKSIREENKEKSKKKEVFHHHLLSGQT